MFSDHNSRVIDGVENQQRRKEAEMFNSSEVLQQLCSSSAEPPSTGFPFFPVVTDPNRTSDPVNTLVWVSDGWSITYSSWRIGYSEGDPLARHAFSVPLQRSILLQSGASVTQNVQVPRLHIISSPHRASAV